MASVAGKWLRIDMEGHSFRVPLRVVLHDKAKCRADDNGGGLSDWLRAIAEEFDDHPEQPAFWLRLMTWDQIAPHAGPIPVPPPEDPRRLWDIGNVNVSTLEAP